MNDPHSSFQAGERPEQLAALTRLIVDRATDTRGYTTKICLLLGAGADIGSGGLSFAQLKRQAIEEFSVRPLFDITPSEEIDALFDDMFVRLDPDDRARLIESLFRRMQALSPSDGYLLLVLLVEAGGIDAIVTTNFDVMLERAQQALGRDLFQIFAPGLARPYPLADHRFALPRKPYLKLHGDIATRSVVYLTSAELERGAYDASMLALFKSILASHDLVIAGYSGQDSALASVIADALNETNNRIFWCNPRAPSRNSPLYTGLGNRIRVVRAAFDQLLLEIAKPVLEKPSLAPTEPTYLRCLFDWRIDYCNREYEHTYAERFGKSIVDTFAATHS